MESLYSQDMKRNSGKLYTTGEFADLFGISKDTLFYYDRIGLFSPAARSSNGYRCYSVHQIGLFEAILSLRNVGINIETIRECFSTKSNEKLLSMFSMEKERIKARITELENTLDSISYLTDLMDDAISRKEGDMEIRHSDALSVVESRIWEADDVEGSDDWNLFLASFSRQSMRSDMLNQGTRIRLEDIISGQFLRIRNIFVYSRSEANATIPSGLYAFAYTSRPYTEFGGIYSDLLKMIDDEGFVPASDSYEEYVLPDITSKSMESSHTRIRIAVERKNPDR